MGAVSGLEAAVNTTQASWSVGLLANTHYMDFSIPLLYIFSFLPASTSSSVANLSLFFSWSLSRLVSFPLLSLLFSLSLPLLSPLVSLPCYLFSCRPSLSDFLISDNAGPWLYNCVCLCVPVLQVVRYSRTSVAHQAHAHTHTHIFICPLSTMPQTYFLQIFRPSNSAFVCDLYHVQITWIRWCLCERVWSALPVPSLPGPVPQTVSNGVRHY